MKRYYPGTPYMGTTAIPGHEEGRALNRRFRSARRFEAMVKRGRLRAWMESRPHQRHVRMARFDRFVAQLEAMHKEAKP